MNIDFNQFIWHDDQGTVLVVSSEQGTALAEVYFSYPPASDVIVQVIVRGRTEAGFPRGSPVLFFEERLAVVPTGPGAAASFWLPRSVVGDHLQNCYFRIRSVEDDAVTKPQR